MLNYFSDRNVITALTVIALVMPFTMVAWRLLDRLANAFVDRYVPDPFAACCCHAEAFNLLASRARISPRPRVEDEKRYVELLGRVRDAAAELLASGPSHTAWASDLSATLDDVVSYELGSAFAKSAGAATSTDNTV